MKPFLKLKVWPVVAGLLVAFIIMMILEYINSYLFPFPEGMEMTDRDAVTAFTSSLPWTAYILVLLGWFFGAFKAGCVTTYLSGEMQYRLSLVTGIILTLLGVANNVMIGAPLLSSAIGLPLFIIGTYLGHVYMKKVRARREIVNLPL